MRMRAALAALFLALSGAVWAADAEPLGADERARRIAKWKEQVVADDAALAKEPGAVGEYSARGDAHLFLGEFREAVADFEKMIALDAAQDAPHWRLGIAYYFAGDFAKSARQFEKYHAYDGRDRENGIWKFLAQAKGEGIEKARAEMLVYTRFDREPFPSLYEMFAGKMTPDEVFAEIEKKGLADNEGVLFFANYYGGLDEELRGHRARALELLRKAVASPLGRGAPGGTGYMWQVARLHWERLRAVEFPDVPGVVVNHLAAATKQFIGSPSIAILPNGGYVATHDIFGPGSTRDRTLVFASHDRGATWQRLAEIAGQWWSTLFVHRGALYLMGTSREYGAAVIRRSEDGGRTWTTPRDADSGLLLGDGKYHCAAVPVLMQGGRVWRAMEDAMGPGVWGSHFRAFMLSAPEDADLLKAASWTASNRLGRDPQWLGGKFGGWLEGNAVAAPDGGIVDLLRVDDRPEGNTAAVIRISADGRTATFDPADGFRTFPGGCKKFTVRFDPASRLYWSLTNFVPARHRGGNPERTRNTLALVASPDLRQWTVRAVVLHHPDVERHGFQYADWQFDGDDLIAVSRTAFDDADGGAENQHNANFLTFHRIRGFRALTPNEEWREELSAGAK